MGATERQMVVDKCCGTGAGWGGMGGEGISFGVAAALKGAKCKLKYICCIFF